MFHYEPSRSIADKINRDVVAALKTPAIADRLYTLSLKPTPGSLADATKFYHEEAALWGKVIKTAHISTE